MTSRTLDEHSSSQTPPSQRKTRTRSPDVTEARARAQRVKLEAQVRKQQRKTSETGREDPSGISASPAAREYDAGSCH